MCVSALFTQLTQTYFSKKCVFCGEAFYPPMGGNTQDGQTHKKAWVDLPIFSLSLRTFVRRVLCSTLDVL